jgi:hypothetical protein
MAIPSWDRAETADGEIAMRLDNQPSGETSCCQSVPHLGGEIAALIAGLRRDLFDAYRPEQHCMRGPGPKWRAKHALIAPDR